MSNNIPVGGKVVPNNPKPKSTPNTTMSGKVLPQKPKTQTTPTRTMSGAVEPPKKGKTGIITAAVALAALGLGILIKNKSDKTSDK